MEKSEIKEVLQDFKKIFVHYLMVNTTEEPTYLMTRQHLGSYVAFGLAAYNTYLLRQKILKNAISLTKSTQPTVVKTAAGAITLLYFTGLAAMWHIPSFFAELAVRVYCSTENAITTVLFKQHLKKEVFNDQRLSFILRDRD
jgi:hypothetical protein